MRKIREFTPKFRARLDIVIAAIILFLLLSPQEVLWAAGIGMFGRFYHAVFGVVVILLALVVAANLVERKRIILRRENVWLGIYLVALILAVVTSVNSQLSLNLLPRYLIGFFLIYIIDSAELTMEKLRRIFFVITVGLAITAIYAIIQRIIGVAPHASFTDLALHPNMPGRVDSFFGNPNVYGFALMLMLPLVLAYSVDALERKNRPQSAVGLTSFVLCGVALIMTYSRGSWVGFAGAVFVFTLFYKPKWIPILLILGALALIPEIIRIRVLSMFNPADTSVESRFVLIEPGLRILRSYPIFGLGLGYDTVRYYVLENLWSPEIRYSFTHTHNLFAQIWSATGIVGFIAFFGAILHNVICSLKNLRTQSSTARIYTAALIGGIAAILLGGIADYTLSFLRVLMLFWVVFALLRVVKD